MTRWLGRAVVGMESVWLCGGPPQQLGGNHTLFCILTGYPMNGRIIHWAGGNGDVETRNPTKWTEEPKAHGHGHPPDV